MKWPCNRSSKGLPNKPVLSSDSFIHLTSTVSIIKMTHQTLQMISPRAFCESYPVSCRCPWYSITEVYLGLSGALKSLSITCYLLLSSLWHCNVSLKFLKDKSSLAHFGWSQQVSLSSRVSNDLSVCGWKTSNIPTAMKWPSIIMCSSMHKSQWRQYCNDSQSRYDLCWKQKHTEEELYRSLLIGVTLPGARPRWWPSTVA